MGIPAPNSTSPSAGNYFTVWKLAFLIVFANKTPFPNERLKYSTDSDFSEMKKFFAYLFYLDLDLFHENVEYKTKFFRSTKNTVISKFI